VLLVIPISGFDSGVHLLIFLVFQQMDVSLLFCSSPLLQHWRSEHYRLRQRGFCHRLLFKTWITNFSERDVAMEDESEDCGRRDESMTMS